MKSIKLSTVFMLAGLVAGSTAYGDEINMRIMPNDINNDITHMRLEALMKGDKDKKKDPLTKNQIGGVFNDDCTLSVGAPPTPGGLSQKPQTIVITGPVINKCR